VQELIDKEKERLDKEKERLDKDDPSEEETDLPIDQDSIDALGFGPISEEYLNELVEAGIVEEYVEDGRIKFRKKKVSNPGSALNPWWKRGI
jgi:hypothetical protein